MPVLQEVLSANNVYAASFGTKSQLALPPLIGTLPILLLTRPGRREIGPWRMNDCFA